MLAEQHWRVGKVARGGKRRREGLRRGGEYGPKHIPRVAHEVGRVGWDISRVLVHHPREQTQVDNVQSFPPHAAQRLEPLRAGVFGRQGHYREGGGERVKGKVPLRESSVNSANPLSGFHVFGIW